MNLELSTVEGLVDAKEYELVVMWVICEVEQKAAYLANQLVFESADRTEIFLVEAMAA